MLPTATQNLLMDPSQQKTLFEGFCALIQDTIHDTPVGTPEAGEQQKRSLARKSDGTSPPRSKQKTSRAPRPQTQAEVIVTEMHVHSPERLVARGRCELNPNAHIIIIDTHVLSYLGAHMYKIHTCTCAHARMLHDQRLAAELAIRTPAMKH